MSSTATPKLPTKELQALLDDAQLPTMPQATLRIMELASDPATSLEHIATAVATDPTLAGRTLGLANSALFYRGTAFESIDRAVSHLGVMRIRSIALALHLFSSAPAQRQKTFDYGYFWRYCLTCAVAAKLLAANQRDFDPEEAFVAALLMDIGVLAFHRAHPQEHDKIFKDKANDGLRLHEKEIEVWGYDHADVGAAIVAHWGLPVELGNAIRLHHRPGDHALARFCYLADLVHAVIYECADADSLCKTTDKLRAQIGDEVPILRNIQVELPHIAEACSCPSWTSSTEEEFKERIAELIDAKPE